ncbi:MAG TPA: SDR family oxidoreductase [Caulobacteraceae bacterium]|jgi:NAD(P)-dependent dehydrogenase (short-subunit alcohol dehydrogenase family)
MSYARYPSLEGKVMFITGGGSGIGATIVEEFHAQGARVAFVSRGDEGYALAERLPGVWFEPCDVTDVPAFKAAIARAAGALGPITILINNVANDTRHVAAETNEDAWRRGLAVNLDAAFIASREVYPGMKAAGGGAIVNVSSINALLGPAEMITYVAAKGAINAMTKGLAREWGVDNIRVNTLSPGWIITERQLELWLTPEAEAEWMELVALKKRIMPADVARLTMFLSADDSALITGQNFVIDGGRT